MTTTRSVFFTLLAALVFVLCGCTTWSSDVRRPGESRVPSLVGRSLKTGRPATDPAKIALVEGAATGKPYEALADISIAARPTLFSRVPTQELLAQRLRAEAAKLGADAVIDVHYEMLHTGPGRVTPPSASGRAVVYK